MATSSQKSALIPQLTKLLKNIPNTVNESAQTRPVLEQLIYAICREHASQQQAETAFYNLQTMFFDWNEVRVSSVEEIVVALQDLSEAELRAERIIQLLQDVYESTYTFDMDSLLKKGVKQAEKQLIRMKGTNRFHVAYTVQNGLGGHSIPLDTYLIRTLRRIGVIDVQSKNTETIQASLQHYIPKSDGVVFFESLSDVTYNYCGEETNCAPCPLNGICSTAEKNLPSNGKPKGLKMKSMKKKRTQSVSNST